ncbi:MAG: TetR/AcrR family transcriptional regulator [Acutalibacteraceae bacterium]|nr:TetR/AcrR family transcriptional regulator [Acutalibacteraceae bacterium]
MAKKEKTKDKIIRVSTRMFLEHGYSATTVQMVCSELKISKGNFTFYFPSKEDVLAVLTDWLCKFQWKLISAEIDDGTSGLLAVCCELMVMAAACEGSDVAKDFFISAYQSPKCLEIIHNNDIARAKEIFAEYCSDWTDEQFREAEILVAGIEHATLNAIDKTVPLETRISGALNTIMMIYNIPEEIRRIKIDKVLAMDYHSLGKRIFKEFKEYVEQMNAE